MGISVDRRSVYGVKSCSGRKRGRTMHTEVLNTVVEEMSVADARRVFAGRVRDALGIGREEFLRRLDAGEYDGTDREDVIALRILAPYGR
jgi:hypothetical protein